MPFTTDKQNPSDTALPPGTHVGTIDDSQEFTSFEVRELIQLLMAAADEIDGWVAR